MQQYPDYTEDDWARIAHDLDSSKELRIQAGFHLESAAKDENIEALCSALEIDPSPIVRHEFAFSLGECAHPDLARPALKRAIETDENIFVRHEAILALATLANKEDIPFLETYLEDKDEEIRESAEIALMRLKD